MEGLYQNLFGKQSAASPAPSADDADFADFAGAPDPSPASISASIPSAAGGAASAVPTVEGAAAAGAAAVPYTAWYRVWERASLSDFTQELYILPFIILIVVVHAWGTRTNRRKAKRWIAAHAPVLQKEFSVVGFSNRKAPSIDSVQSEGLLKAFNNSELLATEELMKERSIQEYSTYATGRANVAFVDVDLTLLKRYNPLSLAMEYGLSFVFESLPTPVEKMETTLYVFDGREKDLVPVRKSREQQEPAEQQRTKNAPSTYDNFVFAIVNKDMMKQLRDERYDVTLTSTRDNAKLPNWATVMSESSEITDTLLTPELIKAVELAGDDLNYLIITDQPLDKPQKLNDAAPRKRLHLSLNLPSSAADSYTTTLPLFSLFLRLPDQLVAQAHFRPEVTRKIKSTRDDESRKLRRADEDEKAEERRLKQEKEKREKREKLLKGLSADEQRKFLEKEREKETRKSQKRMTKRG
ncbi:MAG: hypothetical protein M1819_006706 [Sarea resinae]|nr:MAG: hypothetical protein M1819_006706 [Sarea resinae]